MASCSCGRGGLSGVSAFKTLPTDRYFAKHVRPLLTLVLLRKALKPAGYSPRGKGSLRSVKEPILDILVDKISEDSNRWHDRYAFDLTMGGGYITTNDGEYFILVHRHGGGHETHEFHDRLTGSSKKDAATMLKDIEDMAFDVQDMF